MSATQTLVQDSNPLALSEEYSREINQLPPAARIHAIELILDSLKPDIANPKPDEEPNRITELEGMGNGMFGKTKEEIDEYIRKERDSWG